LITTRINSLPVAFSITCSGVHNAKALDELPEKKTYLKINEMPGDKGYILIPLRLRLFEQKGIEPIVQLRANMKTLLNWTTLLGATRSRMETIFYKVRDQFRPGQNFPKPFNGMLIRITRKLAGLLYCKLSHLQNSRSMIWLNPLYFIRQTTAIFSMLSSSAFLNDGKTGSTLMPAIPQSVSLMGSFELALDLAKNH
jgi:hypothetical protein